LLESLHEYLAEEILDGDNQYRCERCAVKVDATRAVRLHQLPRYVNFQLKRFVFDFETLSRRKVTDAFRFPLEVELGGFVSPLVGGVGGGGGDDSGHGHGHGHGGNGDSAGVSDGGGGGGHSMYDLAFILVHRGQNATSGHYVALVRDDMEASGAGGGNWWRFDDDEVDELWGGPFGEPVPIHAGGVRGTEAGGDGGGDDGGAEGGSSAVKIDEDFTPADAKKKRPAVKSKKLAAAAAGAAAAARAQATAGNGASGSTVKPKKGRDGSTLQNNEFSSPDAYLLVYRRRDPVDGQDGVSEQQLKAKQQKQQQQQQQDVGGTLRSNSQQQQQQQQRAGVSRAHVPEHWQCNHNPKP
jgi:hypothetical protein